MGRNGRRQRQSEGQRGREEEPRASKARNSTTKARANRTREQERAEKRGRAVEEVEGDGRTPEGDYIIDRRNPDSKFHLSIGVSYPNPYDRAFAEALEKSPGGDIFIHGRPPEYQKGGRDWTAGCIAVTDREIEEIYAMVRNGTPIRITP